MFDNNVTLIITVKKSVHENSPKMSTRIHHKCPRKFTLIVHENLPFMSMRSLPPTMNQNGKPDWGWGEILLRYIIFVYHWRSYASRISRKLKKATKFFKGRSKDLNYISSKNLNFFGLCGPFGPPRP